MDSVAKYAILFTAYSDSIHIKQNALQHSRIKSQYNYDHFQKIAKDKTIQIQHLQIILIVILFITFGILVLSVIVNKKIKNHSRQKLLSINRKYSSLLETYSTTLEKQCHQEAMPNNADYQISEKEKIIEELLKEIRHYESLYKMTIHKKAISKVLNNPHILLLHHKASMGLKADADDIKIFIRSNKSCISRS